MRSFVFCLICLRLLLAAPLYGSSDDWSDALPFQRFLKFQTPLMNGDDVTILQNLLRRYSDIPSFTATGHFDEYTEHALIFFQKAEEIRPADGVLDPTTAKRIINLLMSDGYKDDRLVAENCKFKLYVPVYRDRTIETNATLYKCGKNMEVLYVFKVRTRGGTGDRGQALNQLTLHGDTPTGLSTIDLNTKEPNSTSYGPYPILRVVKGIKGNTAIGRDDYIGVDGKDTFLSDYRSGILVHTGEWAKWDDSKPMPNSHGCIHVHPDDMKKMIAILVNKAGVIVNENPFGKLPYPFKPQGIISVEEIR